MNLNLRMKLAYAAPPRTGGRWWFDVLKTIGFVGDPERPETLTHRMNRPPGGYRVIASVRDPLTRFMGVYRWVLETRAGWGALGSAASAGEDAFAEALFSRRGAAAASQVSMLESGRIDGLLRFEGDPRAQAAQVGLVLPPAYPRVWAPKHDLPGEHAMSLVAKHWRDDFLFLKYKLPDDR